MFTNPCIGTIDYEATTSAFVMAGIFLSFLVEYIGHRIVLARSRSRNTVDPSPLPTSDTSGTLSQHDSSGPNPKEHGQYNATRETPAAPGANLAALGHHHGNPYSPTNPNSKLSVLVMEAGVLFHSILIGITLVVAGDSFYKTLLVVIIFHQFFEVSLSLSPSIRPANPHSRCHPTPPPNKAPKPTLLAPS